MKIDSIHHLYHWRIFEYRGGEVWANGIRVNGKPLKVLVFEANLPQMEFNTSSGWMKLAHPDEDFAKNTEALYGSLEGYLRKMINLDCRGRTHGGLNV